MNKDKKHVYMVLWGHYDSWEYRNTELHAEVFRDEEDAQLFATNIVIDKQNETRRSGWWAEVIKKEIR